MPLLKQFITFLCAGFLLTLTLFQSEKGVDHRFYLWWTNAALAADLNQLGEDLPRSINGVPFLHWQAGPGLLATPVGLLLRGFDAESWSLHATGLFCAALFWWTYWHALRLLTDPQRAWYGCLLSAIATPLGHYSLSISSEAIALLPLGVLALQTARGLRGERVNVLAIAASAALLIAIRSYLGVYAWPAMYLAVRQASHRGIGTLITAFLILGACIATAVWQLCVVHYWMTGSPWRSPYQFGDSQFTSWDPNSPHWKSILLDTFHGLFPTHPLMLLAFAAVLVCAYRARVSRESPQPDHSEQPISRVAWHRDEWLVWGITAIAIITHIYIQGCWYYWWLGESSFGMRGLVAAAVPANMALVRCIPNNFFGTETSGRRSAGFRLGFCCVLSACAVWSWLLWQQGPMDYLSWSPLIEGQWLRIQTWFAPELLVVLAIAVFLTGILLAADKTYHNRRIALNIGLLSTLIIAHLLERMTFLPPENLLTFYSTMAFSILLVWGLCQWSLAVPMDAARLSSICACGLFVLSMLAFANLSYRSAGTLARRQSDFVSFNIGDARQAYLTLSLTTRFSTQRDELRGFLLRTQGERFVLDMDRMLEDGGMVRGLRNQGSRTRTPTLLKN
ncbi:MAG: hypothetical protein U1A77_09330 [Pirellulales bacterium]